MSATRPWLSSAQHEAANGAEGENTNRESVLLLMQACAVGRSRTAGTYDD